MPECRLHRIPVPCLPRGPQSRTAGLRPGLHRRTHPSGSGSGYPSPDVRRSWKSGPSGAGRTVTHSLFRSRVHPSPLPTPASSALSCPAAVHPPDLSSPAKYWVRPLLSAPPVCRMFLQTPCADPLPEPAGLRTWHCWNIRRLSAGLCTDGFPFLPAGLCPRSPPCRPAWTAIRKPRPLQKFRRNPPRSPWLPSAAFPAVLSSASVHLLYRQSSAVCCPRRHLQGSCLEISAVHAISRTPSGPFVVHVPYLLIIPSRGPSETIPSAIRRNLNVF